jgi:hypothetical protein
LNCCDFILVICLFFKIYPRSSSAITLQILNSLQRSVIYRFWECHEIWAGRGFRHPNASTGSGCNEAMSHIKSAPCATTQETPSDRTVVRIHFLSNQIGYARRGICKTNSVLTQ